MTNTERIEKITNNIWFTFLSRGSMILLVPGATLLWTAGLTILGDKFDAAHKDIDGIAVRMATVETVVADHSKMLQAHDYKISDIEKSLDTNMPILSATTAKQQRDEDRLDAMAGGIADVRRTVEAISGQLTTVVVELSGIKARLPQPQQHSEGAIGTQGGRSTATEPLTGLPNLSTQQ